MSALSIISSAQNLTPGMRLFISGAGGTAPYAYSVLDVESTAGGSIDSAGVYTAPNNIGVDVIQVTDASGALSTLTVSVGTPLMLVCDIIQREMGLATDQVYLWDQKYNIPNDQRLYIAVGILSCKPFANSNIFDGSGNSIQSTNFLANLSLDIFSRGPDARDRKEEVIMSLNSFYAQSQQDANSFFIGKISNSFVNLSQEEGAAILYRFNIGVNIQYMVTKTKPVPYYDTFQGASVVVEP